MTIQLSESALQDLEALRIYLNDLSTEGLQNVVDDIQQTIESIPEHINLGRRTPKDGVLERISPKYRYLIPYCVKSKTVYILRIYHPSRRPLGYKKK